MKRGDWMTVALIAAIAGPPVCFAIFLAIVRRIMAPPPAQLPRGQRREA